MYCVVLYKLGRFLLDVAIKVAPVLLKKAPLRSKLELRLVPCERYWTPVGGGTRYTEVVLEDKLDFEAIVACEG